ncbi:MAG TPA: hypothetical protein VGP73_18430 [Thermoanaerobaculia bacterium]
MPDLIESWPKLGYLLQQGRHRLEMVTPVPIGSSSPQLSNAAALGIQELPPPGKEWGPGGEVLFFQEHFKASLVSFGVSPLFARALTAALKELASNAIEHSRSPAAPLACYEISKSTWTMAVTDVGQGVLASLRENSSYIALDSHAEALKLALQPGISRTGEKGRGNGFARVFKALVDRRAGLRFRSGGASARWEGTSPTHHSIVFQGLSFARPGFHVRIAGPIA